MNHSSFSSFVALQHMLCTGMSPTTLKRAQDCLQVALHIIPKPSPCMSRPCPQQRNGQHMPDSSREQRAHGRRASRRPPAGTSTTRCTPPRRRRSPTPCRASAPRRPPPPPPPVQARRSALQATALRRCFGTLVCLLGLGGLAPDMHRACTALAHVAVLSADAHLPARGSELRAPRRAAVHGRCVGAVPACMSGQGSVGVASKVTLCAGGCAARQGQRGTGDRHPVSARGLLSEIIS